MTPGAAEPVPSRHPDSRIDPAGLPRLLVGSQAAGGRQDQPRRAFVAQIMGLPMSLHVRGPRAMDPVIQQVADAAFARLRADDGEFSTYQPDSAVSRIQRRELLIRDASPRLREVVALCEEAATRTDGAFSAWIPRDGVPVFDPTGLVKGWAVAEAFERLLADLAALGAHDALLSAGGDVVVACTRIDTPDWVVAVEDPRDRSRVLTSVPLRRGAVATSGVSARGLHVLDAATGSPATALLSATVIGPSLIWADVYATALLASGGDAPWFARLAVDHAALLVAPDGATTVLP
ncbi:MAG: FAD:protein FMN transferase [Lapillicoccus sp.]